MTNLKIAVADIPFNSTRIISTPTLAPLNDIWNLTAGQRYYRTQLAAAAASWAYTFDLGDTYTSKNASANYCIVARSDLADLTDSTSLDIESSSNNASYTTRATSAAAVVKGPRSADHVINFTEAGPFRYWRATWSTGSTRVFQHSKLYLGKWFEFDLDPDYKFQLVSMKDSSWYSSAGSQYFTRAADPIYQVTLDWPHQSDSTVKSFEEKVVKRARECPVFLYTAAQHLILNNVGLLHATLIEYKVTKDWNNLNTIHAVFEEELG